MRARLFGRPKSVNVRPEQIREAASRREKAEIKRELIEGLHREQARRVYAISREIRQEIERERHDAAAFEALVASQNPAGQYGHSYGPRAPRPVGTKLLMADVIRHGCLFFNTSEAFIFSQRRERKVVEPRQIIQWAVSAFLPHLTLPAIGRKFGGRDHTTILHAKRKVEAAIEAGDDLGIKAQAFADSLRATYPHQTLGAN